VRGTPNQKKLAEDSDQLSDRGVSREGNEDPSTRLSRPLKVLDTIPQRIKENDEPDFHIVGSAKVGS